jgi:nicotinamidase/pyrazinamidase
MGNDIQGCKTMNMDPLNCLFWNVDTQIDFVYPRGKLYIEGAENLRPQWKILTELAKEKSIRVVNTADYHFPNSAELDSAPNYINTFPEHCMAKSRGADFIKETDPEDPVIFDWNRKYLITPELFNPQYHRNFIIRKDTFDVFEGNPHTATIIKNLNPDFVVIYGVIANIGVSTAVKGIIRKVKKAYLIQDAIREVTHAAMPVTQWKKKYLEIISLNELKLMLD